MTTSSNIFQGNSKCDAEECCWERCRDLQGGEEKRGEEEEGNVLKLTPLGCYRLDHEWQIMD